MQRDPEAYLEDVLKAIEKIERYTENLSFNDFSGNDVVQDAVFRNLEIIREAVKKISKESRNKHPEAEWRKMARLKDIHILIPECFDEDLKVVWGVIKNKLPELKKQVSEILAETNSGGSEQRYEKGLLTHSKGRLLAYLVWHGKIKCDPSVPADVMRSIGYKSRGHLKTDIDELIRDGYVVHDKKGGCYRPTKKAKKLLEPILSLRRVAELNIAASALLIIFGLLLYVGSGFNLFFILNFLIGVYLFAVNLYAIDPFRLLFKKLPR